MRTRVARSLIELSLALLIVGQVADWLFGLVGAVPALIGAAVVGVIQLVCSRLAGANVRYHVYIWIPTILFTVIPFALRVRHFLARGETSTLARIWGIAPLLVSFVIPVVLLLAAWFCLKDRDATRGG